MTTSCRPDRRRIVRSARRLAVLAAAAGLTVTLAQSTTTAAFTGQTGDLGNSATAATSFCASPVTTVAASADTTVYQSNPTTTYGTNAEVGVGSESSANGRVLVRFALPAPAPHCVLTAATLRLYANSPQAGRTIDAYRVDPTAPSWSEGGTSWSNQPAPTGTAVGAASLSSAGWQQWTVTSMVSSFYAGTNSGFLLRDRTEGSGTSYWQLYRAREYGTSGDRPQLVLTWG